MNEEPIRLAGTWADLEGSDQDSPTQDVRLRVYPEAPVAIYLYCNPAKATRRIEVVVDDVLLPPNVRAIEFVGFEAHALPLANGTAGYCLQLRLTEASAASVFSVLCDDLAHLAAVTSKDDLLVAWLGRLKDWSRLLKRRAKGLRPVERQALYAELLVLADLAIPSLGPVLGVRSWLGPLRERHDFATGFAAVEVKSSIATRPLVATINGERQLDDQGLESPLYLVHFALERSASEGPTLPDLVKRIQEDCSSTEAASEFEDRLIRAKYDHALEQRYSETRFIVRGIKAFRVAGSDFPRITESFLLPGVGDVRYKLSIDACAPFACELGRLFSHGANDE